MSRYKHGHALFRKPTPTYICWNSMVQRCTNPKAINWRYYGGRDIMVCDRWRSFENFLADMGPKPRGKQLDRWPDGDGDYEPGNCRWATKKQQEANKRRVPILYCVNGHLRTPDNVYRSGCIKCQRTAATVYQLRRRSQSK